MDYKMLIELLFTFSPLIFLILIGFFVNPKLTQEERESQRRQTIKRFYDERRQTIKRLDERRQTIKRLDDERVKYHR